MFRRAFLFTSGGFFLIGCLWAFAFGYVRPKDIATCKRLQQQKAAASSNSLASAVQQNRQGVVKEIYFSQEDNTRLHYRIESASSFLTLTPDGNKFDLNEKLEKIKCWMQDKLYYTSPGTGAMQQMRFLEAEDGIYRYNTQQFLANQVNLSLYRISGHELPPSPMEENPFLRGIADEVSFAVSGKTPQFNASHFRALLNQNNTGGKP